MSKHGIFEMELHSGRFVDPTQIKPEDVDINDIAFHLASICRFSGACRVNVADHSVRVAKLVELLGGCAACQYEGVMHDGHEAYLNDVITPLGRQEFMKAHGVLKVSVQGVIEKVYPAPEHHKDCLPDVTWLKTADTLAALLEADTALPSRGRGWVCSTPENMKLVEEYRDYFSELHGPRLPSSEESEILFMKTWEHLRRGNHACYQI